MNTQLNRMLFSRAFVKVSACVVLSAGCLPVAAYAESNGTLVVETVLQKKAISGKVVDSKGEAIIGANIMEKGTTNGTITDFDGKFSLNVSAKGVIVISYIGYKSVEIPIAQIKSGGKITLKEDTEIMDEVVVVGYGTQKKATLTGSVSQVGGEDLKKVAAANLTNTLAGKTAGIIANTRSGEPGEDNADILIRGKGTLGSTSPLIVVDGIADRSFSHLNPEDIESISVLKDASAAIYGARAANGVILVTTKRGKEGKVSVNYNGSYSISQPTRIPEMLNAYQYGTNMMRILAIVSRASLIRMRCLNIIRIMTTRLTIRIQTGGMRSPRIGLEKPSIACLSVEVRTRCHFILLPNICGRMLSIRTRPKIISNFS